MLATRQLTSIPSSVLLSIRCLQTLLSSVTEQDRHTCHLPSLVFQVGGQSEYKQQDKHMVIHAGESQRRGAGQGGPRRDLGARPSGWTQLWKSPGAEAQTLANDACHALANENLSVPCRGWGGQSEPSGWSPSRWSPQRTVTSISAHVQHLPWCRQQDKQLCHPLCGRDSCCAH